MNKKNNEFLEGLKLADALVYSKCVMCGGNEILRDVRKLNEDNYVYVCPVCKDKYARRK